jgi:hypothetical protein
VADSSEAPRREKQVASTALEQFRMLEAESFEEENTERARFFDIQARLEQTHTLLENHRLAHLSWWGSEDVEAREARVTMKIVEDTLSKASFEDGWSQAKIGGLMSPAEAAGWEYQKKNAAGRLALAKGKALMIHLGIYALESAAEAEDRIEMEVFSRPKKG